MQNLSGRKFGNYELREQLGRGGMAEVYKAYQPSMDRFVAIKVMLGHLANDENFIERFKREAQAVGRLRHPHIIDIFDFGIQEDVYYMAMEYVTGSNLKEHIVANKKLPLADSLKIAHDLADALIYAHKAGMIHRDLKPANVMFVDTAANEVVLTDFGIARILGATGITGTGMSVGTPSYMSPEAGQGEDIDERADIYALGIILYEMLVGTVPYDADTPLAVIMKHISAPLPTRANYGDNIPEEVERIILKCLAKDREDRFSSATELRNAIANVIQIAPNIAKTDAVKAPQAKTEVASANATQMDDAPTTMASSKEVNAVANNSKGNPLMLYGIAGIIILAIIGGLYLAFGGSGTDDNAVETPIPQVASSVDETPVAESPAATPVPAETDTFPVELSYGGEQPPNAQNLNLLTNISDIMDTADNMVLAEDLEGAIAYVSDILEDDPDNTSALFARSELHSLSYDEENLAGQDAERLIELEPENVLGYIALHDSWLNYPALEQEDAVDNARSAIDQAYELEPENPHVLWRLARIGDWQLEWERMYSAEDLGANGYRYIRTMGDFLYNIADFERAIPYLEVFMRGTESESYANQESFWNLIGTLIQVDRAEVGLQLFNDSINLDDSIESGLFADGAYIAYRAGEYEQAEEWANAALAFDPEMNEASYVLALIAWWANDDLDEAISQLDALADTEVFSRYLNFFYQHDINIDKARILADADEPEDALIAYNIALDLYSSTAWLYEERADVHIVLEDIESARADLQTAFDVSDDADYRSELRERILDLGE